MLGKPYPFHSVKRKEKLVLVLEMFIYKGVNRFIIIDKEDSLHHLFLFFRLARGKQLLLWKYAHEKLLKPLGIHRL